MPYITGARLKVKRARKHLNELNRKVGAFLDRHPDRFSRQLDPNDFRYFIYKIPPNPAPPGTFGPVFGDVVANLRSALDHIAWNLALLNLEREGADREPYWATAFPLILNTTSGSIDRFYRLLEDVLPDAVPDIIDLQPCHRDHPANTELAILDALWNADKHRVNVTIPARQFVPIFSGTGGRVDTLYDGTRLMRVTLASKPEENLEPYIATEVLFEIPKTTTRIGLNHLELIYKAVSEDVLPRFTRFLPESTGITERQYGTRKRRE